jgi:O-antigen/teichoic acid export membrane protein
VWRATALQAIGRVWGSACTFATLALLARALSAEGFGRYTFWLAVFSLLDAVTDFGTGAVAVRRAAADPSSTAGVLAAGRRARLRTGTGAMGFVLLLALLYGDPGPHWLVLAALYELTHTLELSATVFKTRIRWGVPVTIRAIAAALRLGAVAALVGLGVREASLLVLGTAAASAGANVCLHLASRKHLPRSPRPVVPAQGLVREAFPLGVASICQILYFYVDNAFVRAISGEAELGVYNGGVRLLSFLILGAQHASSSALPWLARRRGDGDLGAAAARLGQPLFAAAALGAGLLWPWRAALLELLYGEGFAGGAAAFGWLLLSVVVIHAGAPLLTAVVASGRGGEVLRVAAAGLLVNVAGNSVLVPAMGAEGAAIATLATEGVVVLGALTALQRAGARPLRARAWAWAFGPLLFLAAAWISLRFAA